MNNLLSNEYIHNWDEAKLHLLHFGSINFCGILWEVDKSGEYLKTETIYKWIDYYLLDVDWIYTKNIIINLSCLL